MSAIVAGELADALAAAGFVIMRKPPALGHSGWAKTIGRRSRRRESDPPLGDIDVSAAVELRCHPLCATLQTTKSLCGEFHLAE
jgi:hypothetical protein